MEYLPSYKDSLYLEHHGILGMRWGIRRFQNKDGSLTKAGKERYQNRDGSLTEAGKKHYAEKGLNLSGGHNSAQSSNLRALGLHDESQPTQLEKARLDAKGSDITKTYPAAYESAVSAISKSNLDKNKKAMSEARGLMKKELQSMKNIDDDELIDLYAYDVAYHLQNKYAKNSSDGKKVQKYLDRAREWFDDAEKTTDKLVKDHGDMTIEALYYGKPKTTTYKDIVAATLLDKAGFLSYTAKPDNIWEEAFDDDRISGSITRFADAIANDFRKNT